MKSWMILIIFTAPLITQAQANKPLSSKVEELLKAKQEKEAREQAVIDEIGREAVTEALEAEKQKRIELLKEQQLKKAVETRFVPKTPFLNFRPEEDSWYWKSTLSFSMDSYETEEIGLSEASGSSINIKKEFKENHLQIKNNFEYGWTKKLVAKYTNVYHVFQTIVNDKHTVSGASAALNPDLTNSKFGDHLFELNYRARKEIFYNYDLDYFLKIDYPFGEASRAYAYPITPGSYSSQTEASQDGNLKSPFSVKAIIGADYFTGKERKRYRYGGSLGYAAKGKYIINKGTGFFSSSPVGLIVDTEPYVDTNLWFEYQRRPKVLEKSFFGFGLYGYFSFDRQEKIVTSGVDGFSWIQNNYHKAFYKINTKAWIKYMVKEHEHWELALGVQVPSSRKINKRIVDEGPDSGGNRQFFGIDTTEEITGRMPIHLAITYALGF